MKKNDDSNDSHLKSSRRKFLTTAGAAAAGIALNPFTKSEQLFAQTQKSSIVTPVKVGVAAATDYDPVTLKTKIQGLFEDIGGISDIASAGNKIAIKINITGGTSPATSQYLKGVPAVESIFTHPEVLRAVGQLLIDGGVRPADIYIVEAIWDQGSYDNYGYKAVQQSLGVNVVNLNNTAPYTSFADVPVGTNAYYYSTIKLNRILTSSEINFFISIPKMKEHRTAGITNGMKNLIGITPISYYQLSGSSGWRSQLHQHVAGGNAYTGLPRSICDLNMARPIHLVVSDGIKNSRGAEVPDGNAFRTCADNILIVGRDPVATDSIATQRMGYNPEATQLLVAGSKTQMCDNHLDLAHNAGIGTNQLSEIQVIGTTGVTSPRQRIAEPDGFVLSQNWPNPFNPTSNITYHTPKSAHVTLKLYNSIGQEVVTLVDGVVSAGDHQLQWNARNLPSGIYFCIMRSGEFSEVIKLVLQK
ncbi:MAG: DUF362 domain-containing protein [Ignavibacteriales bacterium]|nr:DUF362 domain-containing protein [Ignavibacteriales bacterium]